YMPREADAAWPENTVQGRSYVHNTLAYDPRIDYQPWMQANGERMTDGTTYESALAHFSLASLPINLTSSSSCKSSLQNGTSLSVCGGEQTFYIPKPGVGSPGTDNANYYRYRIKTNKSIDRCEWVTNGFSGS